MIVAKEAVGRRLRGLCGGRCRQGGRGGGERGSAVVLVRQWWEGNGWAFARSSPICAARAVHAAQPSASDEKKLFKCSRRALTMPRCRHRVSRHAQPCRLPGMARRAVVECAWGEFRSTNGSLNVDPRLPALPPAAMRKQATAAGVTEGSGRGSRAQQWGGGLPLSSQQQFA